VKCKPTYKDEISANAKSLL
jgi:serine/threonine protein kinase